MSAKGHKESGARSAQKARPNGRAFLRLGQKFSGELPCHIPATLPWSYFVYRLFQCSQHGVQLVGEKSRLHTLAEMSRGEAQEAQGSM